MQSIEIHMCEIPKAPLHIKSDPNAPYITFPTTSDKDLPPFQCHVHLIIKFEPNDN